ncbi:MAG: glycine cleavage system protein GcvH [Bacillota bacterium]
MTYPMEFKYTKDHEYINVQGSEAYVGLSNYAQDQLGDIVFVELPEVGRVIKQGEVFGVVESVKAVSDCYAPAGGTVVRVNERLLDEPDLINKDPHGEGWMMVIELADPSELDELMDINAYRRLLEEVGH